MSEEAEKVEPGREDDRVQGVAAAGDLSQTASSRLDENARQQNSDDVPPEVEVEGGLTGDEQSPTKVNGGWGLLRVPPQEEVPDRLKVKPYSDHLLDPKDPFDTARTIVREEFVTDGRITLWRHRGVFWRWNGSYYKLTDTETLRAFVWEFMDRAQCKGKKEGGLPTYARFKPSVANVTAVVDAMTAVTQLDEHIDPPVWLTTVAGTPPADELFACANGLLHLPTGNVLAPTPDYFCLIASTVNYDPATPDPEQWHKFLDELFGEDQEAIATLQEWFGYMLSPDTSQQKIFGLIGPKRSGKGTITRVLTKLLGEHSVAGPTMNSLGETFGLEPLITKSLATISDVRIGKRTDKSTIVERLLSISGEDQMTVARKFMKAWTGNLPTRIMLSTNELPALTDGSGALASRLVLLALTKSFYGNEDQHLTKKLTAELSGILNWAIVGYRRLHERGHFVQPESGIEAVEAIEALGAPVKAFIRECCAIGPGKSVDADELFNAWRTWCENQGREDTGTKEWFGRNLRSAVPGMTIARPRGGEDRLRKYQGIGLLPM